MSAGPNAIRPCVIAWNRPRPETKKPEVYQSGVHVAEILSVIRIGDRLVVFGGCLNGPMNLLTGGDSKLFLPEELSKRSTIVIFGGLHFMSREILSMDDQKPKYLSGAFDILTMVFKTVHLVSFLMLVDARSMCLRSVASAYLSLMVGWLTISWMRQPFEFSFTPMIIWDVTKPNCLKTHGVVPLYEWLGRKGDMIENTPVH